MSRTSELIEYRKTKHWKQLKKLYSTIPCELCGAKRKKGRVFVLHHKFYSTLYNEQRNDLQILCRRCHNLCHDVLNMKEGSDFVAGLKDYVRKYFAYNDGKRDVNIISETIK
jgi:5-methylcytosine-specific restriction endonuclease McrA